VGVVVVVVMILGTTLLLGLFASLSMKDLSTRMSQQSFHMFTQKITGAGGSGFVPHHASFPMSTTAA